MITVMNNVKMLKEDKKAFIDVNAILNKQIESIINDKIKMIKSISLTQNAKIIISGDTDNFSFNIESEDSKTIKLIQKELNR
jgi:hypothetical protein